MICYLKMNVGKKLLKKTPPCQDGLIDTLRVLLDNYNDTMTICEIAIEGFLT